MLRHTDRPPIETGPRPANLVNINGAHLADLVRASTPFQQALAAHGLDLHVVLAVPGFVTDATPSHAQLFADRLGHHAGRVWASRHHPAQPTRRRRRRRAGGRTAPLTIRLAAGHLATVIRTPPSQPARRSPDTE
jgi:hypothetical protein